MKKVFVFGLLALCLIIQTRADECADYLNDANLAFAQGQWEKAKHYYNLVQKNNCNYNVVDKIKQCDERLHGFSNGYQLKTDVYYRTIFFSNANSTPVYNNPNCSGQPISYLKMGESFVVLDSKKTLYSALLVTVTKVLGKSFPDCLDHAYKIGDKLYLLESVAEGNNLVLNGEREEYACFSIQGDKAVTRYDGCNMIEGNVSGFEKSVVIMHIKTVDYPHREGYLAFEYDGSRNYSTWSAYTYWNTNYNL